VASLIPFYSGIFFRGGGQKCTNLKKRQLLTRREGFVLENKAAKNISSQLKKKA